MSGLEVVGAVVNAVQLVGVLKQILAFISQQHGATERTRAQAAQAENLVDIVTEIHQKPEFQTPTIRSAVNRCLQQAEALLRELKVLTPDNNTKRTAKYRKAWQRSMRNTAIQEIFSSLEREKSTILLCIESINK
jgi:hypothetical protein